MDFFSSLYRIGLVDPHLEVLHTDLGMNACLVGAEAPKFCSHFRLCCYLVANLEGFNMGDQRPDRGTKVLLLVEGGVFLCDLRHVGLGRVRRSGRRV